MTIRSLHRAVHRLVARALHFQKDNPRVLFWDRFNDTPGTSIVDHTPDIYENGWNAPGGGITWSIADDGGSVENDVTPGGDNTLFFDEGDSDGVYETWARIGNSTGETRATFRYSDGQNFWYAQLADDLNTIVLLEVDATVSTVRGTYGTPVVNDGTIYHTKVTLDDDRISVLLDEVPASLLEYTSSHIKTATQHGIGCHKDNHNWTEVKFSELS